MIEAVELAWRIVIALIEGAGLIVGTLVVALAFGRGARAAARRRRTAILRRYQADVDALLQSGTASIALARLLSSPRRHRAVIGETLIAPLRVAGGELADYVRAAATSLGLRDAWRARLRDGRWWVRADAVGALGLIRDRQAVDLVIDALEDPHEEVRAAAAAALGSLGDPSALAVLLVALGNPARHERARIVDALGRFGAAVAPALADHARRHPADAPDLIGVLGLVGGGERVSDLVAWTADERAEVRAAAVAAIGVLDLDERSYYFALRALADEAAEVRVAAARALGRSRRPDAVPYLAARLDDDWPVAAQCAWALRRLGPAGRHALAARAADTGTAGELSRQMLKVIAAPATEAAP